MNVQAKSRVTFLDPVTEEDYGSSVDSDMDPDVKRILEETSREQLAKMSSFPHQSKFGCLSNQSDHLGEVKRDNTMNGLTRVGLVETDSFTGKMKKSDSVKKTTEYDWQYNGHVDSFKEFYHKMETDEWGRVNRILRQHGLQAVTLLHPHNTHHDSDKVSVTPDTSRDLRKTLLTLMQDCDRRQELIQELISTNTQLRDDVKNQTSVSDKFISQTQDLKSMLDTTRSRVKDLEGERFNNSDHMLEEEEKLRNTKNAAQVKCVQIQQKCDMYEAEIDRLKKKVERMTKEDSERLQKQQELFQQWKKKISRGGAIEERVVEVIDSYERQLQQLKAQLQAVSDEGVDIPDISIDNASTNFKSLIKTYERQVKEARRKLKEREDETELLKLELESRPDMKDLREAQVRIKKLERIIRKHGICPAHDGEHVVGSIKFSTHVDDLEFLPQSKCRDILMALCEEVGVFDAQHIILKIKKDAQSSEAHSRLEQFAHEIVDVVTASDALCAVQSDTSGNKTHTVWCDRTQHHTLTTLQHWGLQLRGLRELQQSIVKLSSLLFPWKQYSLDTHPNVTTVALIEMVDQLMYEDDENDTPQSNGRGKPVEGSTKQMLSGIVRHFQELFEVTRVNGVYARMNDIYTKLGEVHNVMKALKDILSLDPQCKSSAVVDAVGQLCQSHHGPAAEQLRNLLRDDDLDNVRHKLQEYDDFFPVFNHIINKLMDVFEVDHLDQIIPAAKAIKCLAAQ